MITELADSAHLCGAQDVLRHVARVRGLLAGNVPAVNLALATAALVQASEGMSFRRYMEDTRRGEKILAASKEGHRVVHGSPKEKAARYAAYQKAVDAKHLAKPAITSWRQLSGLVAKDSGCSGRTIRRHTKNPIKKVGTVRALSHSEPDRLIEN
jgi:hypothetical protein